MAVGLAMTACSTLGTTADTPLTQVRKVNDVMAANPRDDFHIVLIHGIRTSDRNTWRDFRALLCSHLAGQCVSPTPLGPISDKLILHEGAPNANFLGKPVWKSDAAWQGSQPFVDHYIYRLKSGKHLIVDEINWWPLAFAFKCQFIVPDETDLVGPSKDNVTACGNDDETHFQWFKPDMVKAMLATEPKSGGAPIVNGALKTAILDWGISDAVLSLGTLKGLLRETVRCSFTDIAAFNWDSFGSAAPGSAAIPQLTYVCGQDDRAVSFDQLASKDQFLIMSHSLGAFLLMDTFAAAAADAKHYQQPGRDDCLTETTASLRDMVTPGQSAEKASKQSQDSQALCFVLKKSNYLYFFANQFSLLELGRAQGLSDYASDGATSAAPCSDAFSLWAGCGPNANGEKQIVAFSDPGDILTLKVPKVGSATVVNVYPHNSPNILGLIESPAPAHVNYLTNDNVLKIVFGN